MVASAARLGSRQTTAPPFTNQQVPPETRATTLTPTPQAYARAAVARIGLDTMTSPYWAHELLLWVQARRTLRPSPLARRAPPRAPPRPRRRCTHRRPARLSSAPRQALIPDAVTGPALLSSHKGIRFHKKNVAKMEEKCGKNA